jgi:RNA ligase (TIGR02306 family)
MSLHEVKVIRIAQIDKHPDADSLEVVHVWGYTSCARIGDFHVGDLAAFVEPDTMVPVAQPEFAFLADQATDGMKRISAKRLRGVQSFGLLIKARPHWKEGDEVMAELGCTHWEPPPSGDGLDAPAPKVDAVHYDVESMRRFSEIIKPGELVEISEKINGENSRYVFADGELHAGSHTRWKIRDPRVAWWRAAEELGLEAKLALYSDHVHYGELYGSVKGYHYGIDRSKFGLRLAFYDIRYRGEWLPPDDERAIFSELALPVAPILYRGPWDPGLASLADGPSMIHGADNIREGCVVKPLVPRRHEECGRVILKLVSVDYLERKKKGKQANCERNTGAANG